MAPNSRSARKTTFTHNPERRQRAFQSNYQNWTEKERVLVMKRPLADGACS